MASGRNHDRFGLGCIPLVWSLGLSVSHNSALAAVLVGSYSFGIWYLSPDLDTQSKPWYRWRQLKILWVPYQRLVPHRHILSHGPIIGTTCRLLYIAFWLLLLLNVLKAGVPVTEVGIENSVRSAIATAAGRQLLWSVYCGCELAALNHLLLDGLLLPLPYGVKRWLAER